MCFTFLHTSNCRKKIAYVNNGNSTSSPNKISQSWLKKIKSRKQKLFLSKVTKMKLEQDNCNIFQHNVKNTDELQLEARI